jgi:polyhydroxyalkanoate synthase
MLQRTLDTAQFLARDPVARVRTGATPHAVLHRQGSVALRYFSPTEATQTPVLISMPLINTWTIWDLLPEVSLVAALLCRGIPVYLVDWGRPGVEDAQRPMSYFVDDVLGRAFDRARRHAIGAHGTDQLDAIGYCVGGTFLAVHLARHDHARKAAFVCTPIDFHQSGRLARWATPERFPVDVAIDAYGSFPAEKIRDSFAWLRPMGNSRKWVSLWERIDDPAFPELWAALERWNSDGVDFPGETYREYVKQCYFDNALVRGGWVMAGRPVDLKRAKMPALAVAAAEDHIVEPPAATALAEAWGGQVDTQVVKGGHVGVSLSPRLPTVLADWLAR